MRPDIPGEEIITGAASGGGPHVRVFTADGTPLGDGFMAFSASFTGGIQVAVGDFDGQNGEQIAVAAGPGGGPHVKVFHYDASALSDGFYAYAAGYSGGVDIAAANIDGGREEIITVPKGPGGPHVRAFHTDGSPIGGGIFAYGNSVTPGFTVAGGTTQIVVGTRGSPTFARALPLSSLI